MRVIATKSIPFGNKFYKTGEAFEAPDWAAKALMAAQVVRAEDGSEPPPIEQPKRPAKRKYMRRDMVAES